MPIIPFGIVLRHIIALISVTSILEELCDKSVIRESWTWNRPMMDFDDDLRGMCHVEMHIFAYVKRQKVTWIGHEIGITKLMMHQIESIMERDGRQYHQTKIDFYEHLCLQRTNVSMDYKSHSIKESRCCPKSVKI